MNHGKYLSILLVVLLVSSSTYHISLATANSVIGGTTITLYPIADAYVDSENNDTNYGSDSELRISKYEKAEFSYIMFNLSIIPSDATIISATLRLYLDWISAYAFGAAVISTYYCPDSSWSEYEITWNNKPESSPNATYNRYFSGILIKEGYYGWNLTIDVQSSLSQAKLTEVIKIICDSGGAAFFSREGYYGLRKPKLEVRYTLEPIYEVRLESAQDTGAISNLGYVTFGNTTLFLPTDIGVVKGSYEVTYNSGHKFIRWETSGGINVLNASAQTAIVDVLGPGTIRAVGSAQLVEYAYDDEKPESSMHEYGEIAAVAFTPLYSGKLEKARFYLSHVSSQESDTIKVHIMDANRTDIIPAFAQKPMSDGWFDVNLSEYDINVNSGDDFYIGLEWIAQETPMLEIDSSDADLRSWYWDGTKWSSQDDDDYMIRAIITCTSPRSLSTISCSLSAIWTYPHELLVSGSNITVSGSLIPPHVGAVVTIRYYEPDGSIITRETTATDIGNYSDVYAPDKLGKWSVRVFWIGGDEDHEGTASTSTSFEVEENFPPKSILFPFDAVSNITGNSMTLTWYMNHDYDFAEYLIYQSTSPGTLGTVVATIGTQSTTSYTITGLSQNTKYYFTIRVIDAGGLTADSEQISATTLPPGLEIFLDPIPLLGVSILVIVFIIVYLKFIRKPKERLQESKQV